MQTQTLSSRVEENSAQGAGSEKGFTPQISDRVRGLKEFVVNNPPKLDTERLLFLKDVYAETQGLPAPLQRARLFENVMLNKTIFLDENPLAGTLTRLPGGIYPMPEYSCRWMARNSEVPTKFGYLGVTDEDKKRIVEAVEFWKDRNNYDRSQRMFLESTGVDTRQLIRAGIVIESPISVPMGTVNLDFEKVLTQGIRGVIEEIEAQLAQLPLGTVENLKKIHYLNAMKICLQAVINNAHRYAALAREMAETESDTGRKKELERIAKTCAWVPENPARTFYEAIQSYWFVHLAAQIDGPSAAVCPGRFPQYMNPLYQKDKAEGKITKEEAVELLELLFLKFVELGPFHSAMGHASNSGNLETSITLGGYTASGQDATNEMDWLLLEAQHNVALPEPNLVIQYHDKLSPKFMLKAVEVIRDTGLGQPAFINADVAVQKLLFHHMHDGITMEEARTYSIVGCVQPRVTHASSSGWEAAFNMAKMLELALNNGKDPLREWQLGPETGNAEEFTTYEQLHEAVKKQLEYFLPLSRQAATLSIALMMESVPTPYQSSLLDDCIILGKDILDGGARYEVSGDEIVATVDLANSLAAIKKLVFEEKRFTMTELKEALAADFEGYEKIQRMCFDAPKYGNEDEYVDSIVREWYDLAWDIHQTLLTQSGRIARPEAFSISFHNAFGYNTGALPNGRKARSALTDGSVSAMPGTDRNGPTALAHSAAKALDTIKWGSNHLNMKFHPSALSSRDGLKKLVALIKTYHDLQGHHIQFNCVSGETLKDAQAKPENYRDLVVRVAGFSAFFIHLDKGVQDEIIKRTELKF